MDRLELRRTIDASLNQLRRNIYNSLLVDFILCGPGREIKNSYFHFEHALTEKYWGDSCLEI